MIKEHRTVTVAEPEWIRHGECNQCGDCCRQATNLITVCVPIADEAYGRVRYGDPIGHVEQLGGIPVFQIRGPVLMPCPKLDGDRCSINDTKPDYCRDKPSTPEDIDGLSRCSYWFVHRETGEVRGTRPPEVEVPLIGQIAKLNLKRGDALVITSKGRLSEQQCKHIRAALDHFLGTIGLTLSIVPALILEDGLELQVMDVNELRGVNLRRLGGEVEAG